MPLFKLHNVIQNYPWGSKSSIKQLFDIPNPQNQPQAEIWMGAHPNGCSQIADTGRLLSGLIEKNKADLLGEYTASRFSELPYLFKVLAAETPLSIQVHPSKKSAEAGFVRENSQGIELTAANRNYKDANHKPELVYALTFYKAMNGFRPIEQITALFREARIETLAEDIADLEASPDSAGLKKFFRTIMSLEGKRKASALDELCAAHNRVAKTVLAREALEYSRSFRAHYSDDVGLFAPLMLNTLELAPGEAMFLNAETPHAYVEGTGLEIMANSDNVLRAGLTPKYIDTEELIANTRFTPIAPEQLKLNPLNREGKLSFPVPVDDFSFDILTSTDKPQEQHLRSAEILFCIEGRVTVSCADSEIELKPGESLFAGCNTRLYRYRGEGLIARAYN